MDQSPQNRIYLLKCHYFLPSMAESSLNDILLAKFPVLHLHLALTCCCASLLAPFGSLSMTTIRDTAISYCAAVEACSRDSYGSRGAGADCSSDIVSSVLVPSADDCISTVEQGISSRLSCAISSGELASIDVRINEDDLQFIYPRVYHVDYIGVYVLQATR